MNTNPTAPAAKTDPQQTHAAGEFKAPWPLLACRFDPTGQFVFGALQDNTIMRWHLASGKATTLAGHDSWVRTMAFHPTSGAMYSGGYDGRLISWSAAAEAPQPERTVEAHRGWVRSVVVSPDGNLLATGGNDNLLKIWNAADGTLVQDLVGHTNHVYSVAFHPQGRTILSGDLKGAVREWDIATGEQLRHFDASPLWKYDPSFQADMGGVRVMAFDAGGKLLACSGVTDVTNAFGGTYTPAAMIFDVEKGEKLQFHTTQAKVKGFPTGVRFHSDGFVIGSSCGADGGYVSFWKTETPQEFFNFKLPDVARDMDVHPDGLRLATAHEDKTLRLWQMTAKAS